MNGKRFFSTLVVAGATTSCVSSPLVERARFVEDSVGRTSEEDWKGEKIAIELDGAGKGSAGALEIVIDAQTTRVYAVARFVAVADAEDKPSADRSIDEAKKTYQITTSGDTIRVVCRHGQAAGSSAAEDSGCETLSVFVPAGDAARPVALSARATQGTILVAAGGATLRELELRAERGGIDATVATAAGAKISAIAETGDVVARVPPDFAADVVTLSAPGKIDASAFPDVESGRGRGPQGLGARAIELVSRDGSVTLASR
ncbi:MAG: hypothetical protein KF819_20170 [Labilithrix sp.]|nr:hypothetical protein [Labilithrix sp.]